MRMSYSARICWLGVPKAAQKWSTMVTRRREMMRLATKAGRAAPMAVRRTRPPQKTPGGVVQQVPAMRGADVGEVGLPVSSISN